MLKVNEFQFYELAVSIHPLTLVHKDQKYSEIIFDWMTAKTSLQTIFKQRSLEFCFEAANELYASLREVVPDDWDEAVGRLHNDDNAEEPKLGFKAFSIKKAAEKFETILNAELSNSDTYWISPKGTRKTSVLMTSARLELPQSVLQIIPDTAAIEIDEAGRCMLFDNSTAAGFHLFRGTEAVIHAYYEKVVGTQPPKKARNWGAYIKTLNSKHANPQSHRLFASHQRRIPESGFSS